MDIAKGQKVCMRIIIEKISKKHEEDIDILNMIDIKNIDIWKYRYFKDTDF